MSSPKSANPGFGGVVKKVLKTVGMELRVSIPARVVKYDAAKQLIDAKPLIKSTFHDDEGKRVVEDMKVICNVPVIFPGSGGYRMTFPIKVGDVVDLLFSDHSLDIWLAKGGEVDPIDPRRHHISDAVAIPGLRDFAHPLGDVSTDSMKLGLDGGDAQIELKEKEMVLAGGTKPVGRKGDRVSAGTTMSTWIAGVTSALNTLAPGSAVAPTDFGVINEGATKVKA